MSSAFLLLRDATLRCLRQYARVGSAGQTTSDIEVASSDDSYVSINSCKVGSSSSARSCDTRSLLGMKSLYLQGVPIGALSSAESA